MPAKLQIDENLLFLYQCLENSGYKAINFPAVAAVSNCTVPAARMRLSRLRKSIEGGLLQNGRMSVPHVLAKKRKVVEDDEEEDDPVPEGNIGVGLYLVEPPAKRQTRGRIIDLSAAFESDTALDARYHEDSSDDYEEVPTHSEDDQGTAKGDAHTKIAVKRPQNKAKTKTPTTTLKPTGMKSVQVRRGVRATPRSVSTGLKQAGFKASTSAPRTPVQNIADHNPPSIEESPGAPLTPPQSAPQARPRPMTLAIKELSQEEIQADLALYKTGMMVPLTHAALLNRTAAQSPLLPPTSSNSVRSSVSGHGGYNEDGDDEDSASISPSESISVAGQHTSSNIAAGPAPTETQYPVISYLRRLLGN